MNSAGEKLTKAPGRVLNHVMDMLLQASCESFAESPQKIIVICEASHFSWGWLICRETCGKFVLWSLQKSAAYVWSDRLWRHTPDFRASQKERSSLITCIVTPTQYYDFSGMISRETDFALGNIINQNNEPSKSSGAA